MPEPTVHAQLKRLAGLAPDERVSSGRFERLLSTTVREQGQVMDVLGRLEQGLDVIDWSFIDSVRLVAVVEWRRPK